MAWGPKPKSKVTELRAGSQWQQLRRIVLAEEDTCGRCGRPVDKTLSGNDKWGPTIGHIVEVAEAPGLAYDRRNVRLEHRTCNVKAGGRYGRQKQLRGRGTGKTPKRRQSRNW